MRKYGKRCLCFLLALAMVLSNVSVGSVAYASELETVDSARESEKDSNSSDVPEEETEADAEKSENEDDDKSRYTMISLMNHQRTKRMGNHLKTRQKIPAKIKMLVMLWRMKRKKRVFLTKRS